MQQSSSTKGFSSTCYAMLLWDFLDKFPNLPFAKWERDVGDIPEEQWEEALESVRLCSLNVTQRLSQLYIILRVHHTPLKRHNMGLRPNCICARRGREMGDLIHLLLVVSEVASLFATGKLM